MPDYPLACVTLARSVREAFTVPPSSRHPNARKALVDSDAHRVYSVFCHPLPRRRRRNVDARGVRQDVMEMAAVGATR
jgi:hypothetical protein